MGKVCFSDTKKERNRQRFERTITELSNYLYWEYYSLPHLQQVLEVDRIQELDSYRREANKFLRTWEDELIKRTPNLDLIQRTQEEAIHLEHCVSATNDLPPNFINSEDMTNLHCDQRNSLLACQHKSLFYTYRNAVVHDFYAPGLQTNIPEENSDPYYNPHHEIVDSGGNPDDDLHFFDLIYPSSFFYKTATEVIQNGRNYLVNKNIDPLEIIGRSELYWKRRLNIKAHANSRILDQKKKSR